MYVPHDPRSAMPTTRTPSRSTPRTNRDTEVVPVRCPLPSSRADLPTTPYFPRTCLCFLALTRKGLFKLALSPYLYQVSGSPSYSNRLYMFAS